METQKLPLQRCTWLDWLRVIAILAVFIFHSARFFDRFPWHVKNPVTYEWVQMFSMFFSSWGMPLIFVISGASLYFSVDRPLKFIKDKVLRLFVPLVVGVFTHVSIAVYLERLTYRKFTGSFFEFYPHYFNGWYGDGGNFAWMGLHLWYLLVLFVYSLALLPVFYLLKRPLQRGLAWLGGLLALPGMVYVLALPVMGLSVFLDPRTTLGERTWGGWSLAGYIPFLFYGFLLISHQGLQERIRSWRWVSLALAVCITLILVNAFNHYGNAVFGSPGYRLVNGLFGLIAWLWVLSIFGFGMQHLTRQNAFLYLANQAVLPFYILHQTVLLVVGYYVIQWHIPDLARFLIISTSSFILVCLLYEFGIRRVSLMRFLFGMKPLGPAQPSRAATPSRGPEPA